MKKKTRNCFIAAGIVFLLFVLFTAAVQTIDVRPIGPEGSKVGFAAVNGFMHTMIGVHMLWYRITEILGVVALLTALAFALLGLVQLVRRKSVLLVDKSILALGAVYFLMAVFYEFFEHYVVNYRPVEFERGLEASFPSSHTMLAICIMATAAMQFHIRIKNSAWRNAAENISIAILLTVVIGRIVSGVHWFTDIVGGLLLGVMFIMLYWAFVRWSADIRSRSKHRR